MTIQQLHSFCVYYFQNIMEADEPMPNKECVMFWQLRERILLSKELKRRYGLKHNTRTIWNTIHYYFNRNFMKIHFDSID